MTRVESKIRERMEQCKHAFGHEATMSIYRVGVMILESIAEIEERLPPREAYKMELEDPRKLQSVGRTCCEILDECDDIRVTLQFLRHFTRFECICDTRAAWLSVCDPDDPSDSPETPEDRL